MVDGDDGQLRRARESEWQEANSSAASDIWPGVAIGKSAHRKTCRFAGQPQDRHQRETDLSAMRVTCEHRLLLCEKLLSQGSH
jgi:hypothetical protein